jgi:hypothetical protein
MMIVATISAIVVVSIDDHRAILLGHRGDQARSPRRSARSITTSGPNGRDDRRHASHDPWAITMILCADHHEQVQRSVPQCLQVPDTPGESALWGLSMGA